MGSKSQAAAYESTLDQLLLIVDLMNRDMAVELSDRGLTPSRTHVLWELVQRPDATQTELARAVGVAPRTMTGLIDGLAGSGFVTRQPHPSDRRASVIELTAKGVEATTWLTSSHRDLAVTLFGDVDDAQFATFAAVLTRVAARLREATAPGQPGPDLTGPGIDGPGIDRNGR